MSIIRLFWKSLKKSLKEINIPEECEKQRRENSVKIWCPYCGASFYTKYNCSCYNKRKCS